MPRAPLLLGASSGEELRYSGASAAFWTGFLGGTLEAGPPGPPTSSMGAPGAGSVGKTAVYI